MLVQSQFLVTWWETGSALPDERKTLHLHYSIVTSRLISAQGHQYFWHFSGGINIEWMSLCCAWGDTRLRASTEITWICLLACSVSRRDWHSSPRSLLSISCIINNIQFGLLNYEKYTARAGGRELTRNQAVVWAMGKRREWFGFKFMLQVWLFLLKSRTRIHTKKIPLKINQAARNYTHSWIWILQIYNFFS